MNKLKPCQNDKCIKQCNQVESGCLKDFTNKNKTLENCNLYPSEKQESAWEMIRRLEKEYGKLFFKKLCEYFSVDYNKIHYDIMKAALKIKLLDNYTEQEAIKIMQKTEKHLTKVKKGSKL
jgi:hypothetical protein